MIPLFLTEEQVAANVLGRGKLREWRAMAQVLERHGLPPIDKLTGCRYWPAVQKFFDGRHGVTTDTPTKPDGVETWTTARKPKRRDCGGEPARTDNVTPIGLPARS